MSAMELLRGATGPAHEAIDAAFGAHDLAAPDTYRAFLLAHARALPPAERVMQSLPLGRALPLRTALLSTDLDALGCAKPLPLAFDAPDDPAFTWGVLYVVEGSRLGGAMLVRQVPDGMPRAYLGAVHGPGQWRMIRAALDDAAAAHDATWRDRMIRGALETFDLYGRAIAVAG